MSIDHLIQNDSQGPQRGKSMDRDGSMDGFASIFGAVKSLGMKHPRRDVPEVDGSMVN